MDATNPVLALHHSRCGETGKARPRASTVLHQCLLWGEAGVPGVGPLQTLDPRLLMRTLNRGFRTTKTVGS